METRTKCKRYYKGLAKIKRNSMKRKKTLVGWTYPNWDLWRDDPEIEHSDIHRLRRYVRFEKVIPVKVRITIEEI